MKKNTAIILICIIHVVGIMGIAFPATRSLTLSLTPINLGITLFFLLSFHKKYSLNAITGLFIVALAGFFIEVSGVASQNLFGAYSYGQTLGPCYWNVPFAMGINWLILIYSTRIIAQSFSKNVILISLISAILMVAFDFILEPVATFMDMWHWKLGIIPIQNYIMWFVGAFFIQLLYCSIDKKVQNPLAVSVFIIQLIFFGLLRGFLFLS